MSEYVHLIAKDPDNVTTFSFLTSVWKGIEIINLWRQCQWFDCHPSVDNQEKRTSAEEHLYQLIGVACVERDYFRSEIQMNFIHNVDQTVLF
ncbi:MAG: hypothetical protein KBB77_01365 [Candidatus Moranbacteria bacterium]|nr:hypothetical protein [Candidatus Moranbacteria bacterium]